MRWILLWIMPLVQDWSLDLLTISPMHYHCTTDTPKQLCTIYYNDWPTSCACLSLTRCMCLRITWHSDSVGGRGGWFGRCTSNGSNVALNGNGACFRSTSSDAASSALLALLASLLEAAAAEAPPSSWRDFVTVADLDSFWPSLKHGEQNHIQNNFIYILLSYSVQKLLATVESYFML